MENYDAGGFRQCGLGWKLRGLRGSLRKWSIFDCLVAALEEQRMPLEVAPHIALCQLRTASPGCLLAPSPRHPFALADAVAQQAARGGAAAGESDEDAGLEVSPIL